MGANVNAFLRVYSPDGVNTRVYASKQYNSGHIQLANITQPVPLNTQTVISSPGTSKDGAVSFLTLLLPEWITAISVWVIKSMRAVVTLL